MDGSHRQSGVFTLQPNGTSKFLRWSNGSVNLGSSSDLGAAWRITQEPMAPAGLSMANVGLYPATQGQVFTPVLQQAGSPPETWSTSPALPAFLNLNSPPGNIPQVPGQPPPVLAAATSTLSVRKPLPAPPPPTPSPTPSTRNH